MGNYQITTRFDGMIWGSYRIDSGGGEDLCQFSQAIFADFKTPLPHGEIPSKLLRAL